MIHIIQMINGIKEIPEQSQNASPLQVRIHLKKLRDSIFDNTLDSPSRYICAKPSSIVESGWTETQTFPFLIISAQSDRSNQDI